MTAESFLAKTSAWRLLAQKVNLSKQPVSAMIEIADRCNEVCIHCYQIQGQKGEMSTEQIFGVLEELAEMGVLFLTISGGEPTLRPDFLEIVQRARQLKFAVKVYSNGLRVDEEMAGKLGALAIQEFQTSLYSHRATVHDWVTRVPGSFDKTVGAVRALRREGVAVLVKTPLMSFNVDDYAAHIEFVQSLGAEFQFDSEINPREGGEMDPTGLRISPESRVKLRRDPRLDPAAGQVPPEPPLDAPTCGACRGNVHVEANGELRPCTLLEVPVGNALDPRGLRVAYHEDETAAQIRSLTWADHHGCRDCDLRPYCQRCFANARKEGGDALGPYESACVKAHSRYEAVHMAKVGAQDESESEPLVKLGPFREVQPGILMNIEDNLTQSDESLRERMGWVMHDRGDHSSAGDAGAGELVQLRRPGSRERQHEEIPYNLFSDLAGEG